MGATLVVLKLFFCFCAINFIFCIDVVRYELLHDVETIFYLYEILTASGNLC